MNNKAATRIAIRSVLLKCLALVLSICALTLSPARAQTRPGGTTVQSNGSKQKKAVAYYSCPMDRDVRAKAPGKCPKCGMDLRPVREQAADVGAAASSEGSDGAASASSTQPIAGEPAASEGGHVPGMKIPDIELLDQDGRKVHFYTDLVKGRTVAINFIFTTCTTICPPLGATFARVQKDLGERTGRDVQFISISVDPATDTPERLKAWGAKFHAGPGWTFVTGDKPSVDRLLSALAASSARREDHSPEVLIGNDARGTWTRTYGLAAASKLVQLINDAVEGKSAAGTTAQTPEGRAN